jgi:molybdopterin converting factor small subunit
MIKTYKRGDTTQLSPNFKASEFRCKGKDCCEEFKIDEALVEWLQKIRDHFGKSVTVNSGYRCPVHNPKVGGSPSSHHMRGQAADIWISGVAPRKIAEYAEQIGVKRIGLYETEKDGYFVHIGSDKTKWFWYGQAGKAVDTFQDTSKVPEGNSPLVSYVNLSPNKNSPRNHKIDTITIHCVVGQLTAKEIVNIDKFQNESGQSSCNYAVGTDGSIGLCVEEKDRAWTSSSRDNDHRAITIEVASDKTAPYAVNDKAMKALIELVADICKRNDIKELKWKADKSLVGQVDKQNMTVHKWFANTSCPGEYLYGKMGYIADAVNEKLGIKKPSVNVSDNKPTESQMEYFVRKNWADSKSQIGAYSILANAKNACDKAGKEYFVFNSKGVVVYPEVNNKKDPSNTEMKVGDTITLMPATKYASGGAIPDWVFKATLYIRNINNDLVTFSTRKTGPITGVVKKDDVIVKTDSTSETPTTFVPYITMITADILNVRAGAGSQYKITTQVKKNQLYTIVGEKDGWGKLKSGAGWISLKYTKKVK